MATITLSIEPGITFNRHVYNQVEFTDSAQKHHGVKSTDIYLYITGTLDRQNRSPDKFGRDGGAVYHLASHIVSNEAPKITDYRDTCFRASPETGTIRFFHGCRITKTRFESCQEKLKKRLE